MAQQTNDTGLPSQALVELIAAVRKDTQETVATTDGNLAALQQDKYGNLRMTLGDGQGTALDRLTTAIANQNGVLESMRGLLEEMRDLLMRIGPG